MYNKHEILKINFVCEFSDASASFDSLNTLDGGAAVRAADGEGLEGVRRDGRKVHSAVHRVCQEAQILSRKQLRKVLCPGMFSMTIHSMHTYEQCCTHLRNYAD